MDHEAIGEIASRMGRRIRAAEGYTLIELIVGIAAAFAILGAVMVVVVAAASVQNHTSNRTEAEFTGQAGVAELGRLIRQATSVTYTSGGTQPGQAKISLAGGPLGATAIDCSTGACAVSGGSTGQPLSSVTNNDVFTLWCRSSGASSSDLTTSGCSNYSYVTVRALIAVNCGNEEVQTCANKSVEIDDGFELSS